MAPRLLSLLAPLVLVTTGCLNPFFFENVEEPVNHAPILTDMEPAPSFERIEVNVAPNCGPLVTFRPARLDDADFDTLTVRWSLFFAQTGSEDGARRILFEEDLEPCSGGSPCPSDDPEVPIYDFHPFELVHENVRDALGLAELDAQTGGAPGVEGQLLELRISDGGFQTGKDDARDGAALVYMSWPIRLRRIPEGC